MKDTDAPSRWYHRLVPASKADIKRIERLIIMNNAELKTALDAANEKLAKIITEIKTLKDAVTNADVVPPEIEASAGRLAALVGEADDLNPDAAP